MAHSSAPRPRRRGRLLRRILLAVLVVVLVAAVGGYWYVRPLLLTGTGYAAHNECAVRWVAGRSAPETDLPPNPLVPYLRSGADEAAKTASVSVLGVLSDQRARFIPGYGCRLGDDPPPATAASPISGSANPFSSGAGALRAGAQPPSAQVTSGVTAAIAAAFGDGLPDADRKALGTRAVVVVRDGVIVGERYADGFTATTPQLGWSMAKSVTNLVAGRLVQQGKLKVTDDHLRPEWTDDRARITVDQLMRMTSGLSWNEEYDLGTPITRMLYLEPDMARYAAGLPLAHPVGGYQQYSSGSTNILSALLATRSGAGSDTPRRELLAPLGLSSATWEPDGAGTPVGSSYLWASPRDWVAIGQFALQDGVWSGQRLLPEGWLKQSTTALPTAGEEQGYAAGWWVNKQADGTLVWPGLPSDAYWAQGHDGQRLYVVPSARLVVVRLGFSPKVEAGKLRTNELVQALAALPG